ncbi:MAG TPA: sulfatase [Candidatus Hydrogenedentes bacterium]|nr:sulfatase [Candidatus Hydrogenedentota bacterium]
MKDRPEQNGRPGGLGWMLGLLAGMALCLLLLAVPQVPGKCPWREKSQEVTAEAVPSPAHSGEALPSDFQSVFPPSNLNPSFEIPGVSGVAANWSVTGPDGAFTLISGNARSGHYAVQASGSGQPVTLVGEALPVGAGDFAAALAWFQSVENGTSRVSLRIEGLRGKNWERIDLSGDKAVSREELNLPLSAHAAWQPRSACVVVPSGVERIRLALEITGDSDRSAFSVRIDDAVLYVSSFRKTVASAAGEPSRPDILLAVADALSVYYTSTHPAGRGYTPNLQALAADGISFDNAFTPAPWTRPAIASIFTSLYPSQHGAELVNSVLPDTAVTLGEVLHDAGYYTAGFARTYYDGFLGPGTGMAQGFDLYYFSDDEDEVFRAAAAFLDENRDVIARPDRRGLFLFVHLFEPHSSYINRFPGLIRNAGTLGDLMTNQIIDGLVERGENPDQTHRADMDYARACYASEVTFMDDRFGELLFRLKHLGRYEKSVIIFTADHGESFGERSMVWNHGNPHVTTTRVPLILHAPDVDHGTRRTDPVSTLDIFPTMLGLAGVAVPERLEGISLLKEGDSRRLLVSEDKSRGIQGEGSITITDGRLKLTVWKASRRESAQDWTSSRWVLYDPISPSVWELADLEADPMELLDASTRFPEERERLKGALKSHCERTGITGSATAPPQGEQHPLSEGAQEDLRSIGYL